MKSVIRISPKSGLVVGACSVVLTVGFHNFVEILARAVGEPGPNVLHDIACFLLLLGLGWTAVAITNVRHSARIEEGLLKAWTGKAGKIDSVLAIACLSALVFWAVAILFGKSWFPYGSVLVASLGAWVAFALNGRDSAWKVYRPEDVRSVRRLEQRGESLLVLDTSSGIVCIASLRVDGDVESWLQTGTRNVSGG